MNSTNLTAITTASASVAPVPIINGTFTPSLNGTTAQTSGFNISAVVQTPQSLQTNGVTTPLPPNRGEMTHSNFTQLMDRNFPATPNVTDLNWAPQTSTRPPREQRTSTLRREGGNSAQRKQKKEARKKAEKREQTKSPQNKGSTQSGASGVKSTPNSKQTSASATPPASSSMPQATSTSQAPVATSEHNNQGARSKIRSQDTGSTSQLRRAAPTVQENERTQRHAARNRRAATATVNHANQKEVPQNAVICGAQTSGSGSNEKVTKYHYLHPKLPATEVVTVEKAKANCQNMQSQPDSANCKSQIENLCKLSFARVDTSDNTECNALKSYAQEEQENVNSWQRSLTCTSNADSQNQNGGAGGQGGRSSSSGNNVPHTKQRKLASMDVICGAEKESGNSNKIKKYHTIKANLPTKQTVTAQEAKEAGTTLQSASGGSQSYCQNQMKTYAKLWSDRVNTTNITQCNEFKTIDEEFKNSWQENLDCNPTTTPAPTTTTTTAPATTTTTAPATTTTTASPTTTITASTMNATAAPNTTASTMNAEAPTITTAPSNTLKDKFLEVITIVAPLAAAIAAITTFAFAVRNWVVSSRLLARTDTDYNLALKVNVSGIDLDRSSEKDSETIPLKAKKGSKNSSLKPNKGSEIDLEMASLGSEHTEEQTTDQNSQLQSPPTYEEACYVEVHPQPSAPPHEYPEYEISKPTPTPRKYRSNK